VLALAAGYAIPHCDAQQQLEGSQEPTYTDREQSLDNQRHDTASNDLLDNPSVDCKASSTTQPNSHQAHCVHSYLQHNRRRPRAQHSSARPRARLYKMTGSSCGTNTGSKSLRAHRCMPYMALHVRLQDSTAALAVSPKPSSPFHGVAHIRNPWQLATKTVARIK
jgi:hypothetical protein